MQRPYSWQADVFGSWELWVSIMRARHLEECKMSRLIDITPPEFACEVTMSCPAMFKDETSGQYVIIGKRPNQQILDELAKLNKLPVDGESVIVISEELVKLELAEALKS